MLMEFKAGDRVRVLRFNGEDVDFYGTLKYLDKCMANLFDCTIKRNEGMAVFLPSDNSFGEDKEDYYILAEDEEDTKGGNNLPTIKRKVEMNLPQLIEWLLESGKSECIVISNMNNIVQLEPYGVIRFSQEKFYPEETFTVEVEERIDEDTEIIALVELSSRGLLGKTT